ncbi:MAG: Uma2 family endonuclease [Anaerolineaceae bacterium]|nr:Uma2 family endonuclease [Anaerolineaceae bacterium]
MVDSGILTEDDPVELLEGWLVTKMPKNPQHTLANQLTSAALMRVVPAGWFVNVQEPITTADSEPEPDVAVVRGDRRDYKERHPAPGDVALVVEISDATLQRDRTIKLRLYAGAGIPVYWILNLPDQLLHVHTDPEGSGERAIYRQQTTYDLADEVSVIIDGQTIAQLPVQGLFS